MIADSRWSTEVIDIMLTIELALIFNFGRNKHSTVRRTCNKLKYRMSPDIKLILHSWARSNEPFTNYTTFMNKAGL